QALEAARRQPHVLRDHVVAFHAARDAPAPVGLEVEDLPGLLDHPVEYPLLVVALEVRLARFLALGAWHRLVTFLENVRLILARTAGSLRLDPDRLDDFRPFRGLTADIGGEFFLRTGDDVHALVGEDRFHVRLSERLHQLGMDAIYDGFRRPRRGEHAVPRGRL